MSMSMFYEACEAAEGWAGCKQYVADNAPFVAQSEPLADINTVEAYCEWMAGFASVTVPGATYDLHTSSYDENTRTAVFFATYNAKHTGEGGPVPPTQKETHSHYVYFINDECGQQGRANGESMERIVGNERTRLGIGVTIEC